MVACEAVTCILLNLGARSGSIGCTHWQVVAALRKGGVVYMYGWLSDSSVHVPVSALMGGHTIDRCAPDALVHVVSSRTPATVGCIAWRHSSRS